MGAKERTSLYYIKWCEWLIDWCGWSIAVVQEVFRRLGMGEKWGEKYTKMPKNTAYRDFTFYERTYFGDRLYIFVLKLLENFTLACMYTVHTKRMSMRRPWFVLSLVTWWVNVSEEVTRKTIVCLHFPFIRKRTHKTKMTECFIFVHGFKTIWKVMPWSCIFPLLQYTLVS